MTKDEALKLALEALEYASTGNRRPEIIGQAITAIKEALAQPEQEPVQDENAIRADEREACAKMCDDVGAWPPLGPEHCAEGIRARGLPATQGGNE